MEGHFHTGFDAFLFVGIAAWLFLALMRLVAAKLAQSQGPIGSLGAAMGATL